MTEQVLWSPLRLPLACELLRFGYTALIFYDTETTGMNTTFDQILHFAGVLTDDEFNELDRFEIRGRLLPNLVPLRVTYSASAAVSALAIF